MIQDRDDAIAVRYNYDENLEERSVEVAVYSQSDERSPSNYCEFLFKEGCLTIKPKGWVELGANNTQWLLNCLRAASRRTAGLPGDQLTPEEAAALPNESRPWPSSMKDDYDDDISFINISDTYAHIVFEQNEEEVRMCLDSINLRIMAGKLLMAAEHLEHKRLRIPYES